MVSFYKVVNTKDYVVVLGTLRESSYEVHYPNVLTTPQMFLMVSLYKVVNTHDYVVVLGTFRLSSYEVHYPNVLTTSQMF